MIKPIFVVVIVGLALVIYLTIGNKLLDLGVTIKPFVQQEALFSAQEPEPDMKTILLWTAWYGKWESWSLSDLGYSWEGNKHTDLRDLGCDEESYKCTITSNRSYLEDESLYDGFLFHQYGINQMDVPDQSKRKDNQVYMFYTLEAPQASVIFDPNHLNWSETINNNFFNATMTYHSESEIFVPFGRLLKKADHPTGEELDQFIIKYGKQNARKMNARNFSATIINSNCASWGGREALITDMAKLMPVDVYGGCGKPFEEETSYHLQVGGSPIARGYKQLSKKYPFYLAFENTLCEDYVTERFYITLGTDMIPVVMNWANMTRFAPKHSYIDVKDFDTITDLVSYLQQVHSDPALYASYFWWSEFYDVEHAPVFTRLFVQYFCDACRYLHSGKGPQVVEDLYTQWAVDKCKQPPIII